MRLPRLLLSVIGGLFLLGCACGQLLTGDPLFDVRGFHDDAEALIDAKCPGDDPVSQELRRLCERVWSAVADERMSREDIFSLEVLLEERLQDGCQADDVERILARYPVLAE